MSVFTTKVDGKRVTVVAANVSFVVEADNGKAIIQYVDGCCHVTEVGYDSVRKNVAKALGKTQEADSE